MDGVVMLLASADGTVGGAQRQAGLLAAELARRGVPVMLVNQRPPDAAARPPAAGDGVERVSLPVLGWCARASFLLAFLGWAARNRRRFRVIHAHGTSAGLTAGLVGAVLGKPVVVKVTGMRSVTALAGARPSRLLRRWLLNRTSGAIVAVTAEMVDGLAAVGVGGPRRVLIPNGVSLAPAAPGPAPMPLPAGPRVLYVGRVAEVKGVRALLAAWSALPRPDLATLLIVGDGPLRPALEREVAARSLGPSVRFLGTQADVAPFYLTADVFVLPSASEGLSNALLEAMAAGLPAVASDVGGNRDVIDHEVNGFLVDWQDARAAAALLARLLGDADLRRRIGAAARRRAADFSIAAAAERHADLYRTLAGRRPAPSPVEATR